MRRPGIEADDLGRKCCRVARQIAKPDIVLMPGKRDASSGFHQKNRTEIDEHGNRIQCDFDAGAFSAAQSRVNSAWNRNGVVGRLARARYARF